MRRKNVPPVFKWRHFSPDVILLCVRWYLSYQLSYRDLVEMMDERGLKIAHSTILRWVLKYSMELKKRVRHHLKKRNRSWRMDETYIKVKGNGNTCFEQLIPMEKPSIFTYPIPAIQPQPSDSLSVYVTIDHPISLALLMLIKILPIPMQNDSY